MRACTIIAKNQLAYARVLAESLLEHNPGSELVVLVIDELDGRFDPAMERFTVLSPRDIDCAPFDRLAARYDALELAKAVKPWLLSHQLQVGAETITYLDPDIRVFGSMDLLEHEARDHGLVLTPYNARPIPQDGEQPSQFDIVTAGVYDLGCVSLGHSEEIGELIDWWCHRIAGDRRVDRVHGPRVDERWIDLAPGFVSDCSIIRQPEYDVAYWNVHGRDLAEEDDHYTVDDRPLAFFHFRGFDPLVPAILSRDQTRVDLAGMPVLRRICAEYADGVLSRDHERSRQWPYTFATLADGTAMSTPLRTIYTLGEDAGALTESPFNPPGCRALLQWAAEQPPDGPAGVNRALLRAYRGRADLQAAFPDLAGASREPFLRWARDHGPDELELPTSLLPPPEAPPRARPRPTGEAPRAIAPSWGVNVVGYFRSELGVGEAGRQVVSALDAVAVPLLPLHGRTIPLSRQRHDFHHLDDRDACYPINLICMNPHALPDFAGHAGPSFFADRYSIGLWFWEVTAAPEDGWKQAFDLLDEVWAPTRHVAEAVASVSPIPVVQVRLPIEVRSTSPMARGELGLPAGFLFFFSFDYFSVFERKNPLAVVDAYRRTFASDEGAGLVIKCINREHDPENHLRLLDAVGSRPDIRVIDGYLDPRVKDALSASCDCYVSLHRSEGFGLTMAEAMYQAKPVIATNYSGNLDFMTPENSYLIDYELVRIGEHASPYPADGVWADPDVDAATVAMREVFDDRTASADRGRRAAVSIRETHSAPVAGAKMMERLNWLRAVRGAGRTPSCVDPSLRPTLERRPASPRSAAGRARQKLRRGAWRLMKPLGAHQRTVNEQVVRSLESLDRELALVRAAQQRTEATELADARMAKRHAAELRHDVDDLVASREQIVQRPDGLAYEQQALEPGRPALPRGG